MVKEFNLVVQKGCKLIIEYAQSYSDIQFAKNKKQSNEIQLAHRVKRLNLKPIHSMKKQSRIEKRCKKIKLDMKLKGKSR